MKVLFYKHLSFSLILIIIWISYLFFGYLIEEGMFYGMGLFFKYLYSLIIVEFLGLLTIIIRFVFTKKNQKHIPKTDFFVVLFATFNILIFISFLISVYLKILSFEFENMYFYIGSPIIGMILTTIIIKKLKTNNP